MRSTKSILAVLLVCSLLASCFSAAAASAPETSADDATVMIDELQALRSWVLTAGFSGENMINGYEVSEDAVFFMFNAESGEFEEDELTEDAVYGSFVALYDIDEDECADVVCAVRYEDSDLVWDSSMAWCDGAGEAEPGTDDETGYEVFGSENVIPYGERLLTGIGFGDYSGPVDFQNAENITYWSDNDYYNATSSDTLTMLTGYKTTLQPTSWTCGLSSALSCLDWYGLRGTLNAYDLANLRGIDEWECGTPIFTVINALDSLHDMGIIPAYSYEASTPESYELYDPSWIIGHLSQGHPVMVMWNSFGWHWQTIIGYDTMGTDIANDDVLIMMDPYDTTDQHANGYELECYQRLAYGVCFDPELGSTGTQYFVFWPEEGFEYTPVMGDGIVADENNNGVFTDENKMSYADTAADLQNYYPDTMYLGDNGLAGPATGGFERCGDHANSPYFQHLDFYNLESTDTLHMLTNFSTIQQATEWTCGLASALMVMNWFDMAEGESDISLATHRQDAVPGATYIDGMKEVFTYMNDTYGQDWIWISTEDLDDPFGEESYIGDYCLQAGTAEEWYGLIPYLLDNGIPIMIGSDEWGGHWQVIIGYDDMGTVYRTEDDVLILADPYDTTDHNQDGYYIDGFERLVYGWYATYEPEYNHNAFIAAFPASMYADVAEALGK